MRCPVCGGTGVIGGLRVVEDVIGRDDLPVDVAYLRALIVDALQIVAMSATELPDAQADNLACAIVHAAQNPSPN